MTVYCSLYSHMHNTLGSASLHGVEWSLISISKVWDLIYLLKPHAKSEL